MTNSANVNLNNQGLGWRFFNIFFGIIVIGIGVVNVFWGNDPGFGIFLLVLSCAYFPPVQARIKEKLGFAIPAIVKVLLGAFILWAALGVGELPAKVNLMINGL
jgi:hypothetical protein